jgi:orotate phosphoribosyltransferase
MTRSDELKEAVISPLYICKEKDALRPLSIKTSRTLARPFFEVITGKFCSLYPLQSSDKEKIAVIAIASSGYPLAHAIAAGIAQYIGEINVYESAIDPSRPVRISELWLEPLASMRTIVVDNSITTGKTARETLGTLASYHIYPEAFVKLIDYQDELEVSTIEKLSQRYDTRFMSLFTLDEILQVFDINLKNKEDTHV